MSIQQGCHGLKISPETNSERHRQRACRPSNMVCGQKSLGLPGCRHNQNRNCYFFMSLHGLPLVLFPSSNNAQGSSWFIRCAGLPPDSLGSHCRDPPTSPLFKKKKIIYFWLCWVFAAARAFLQQGLLSVGVLRLLLLWSTGSRHVGFRNCNTWAQ